MNSIAFYVVFSIVRTSIYYSSHDMITAIIVGILIFMWLVVIHEYGHFWTSRKFGVKVEEFGIGIPPKVHTLTTDKKWTEYTINRIPLGWFVRLKGEDPNNEQEFLAPDSFISASLVGKLIILFWWIIANIIFARIAFSISLWQGVQPISILPDTATAVESTSYMMPSYSFLQRSWFIPTSSWNKVTPPIIQQILPESRATSVWLQIGDTITFIQDVAVTQENLTELLKQHYGEAFVLTYLRDTTEQKTTITCGKDECLLWIGLTMQGIHTKNITIQFPFMTALKAGWHEIVSQTTMSFRALGKVGKWLFSFKKAQVAESAKSLSGPVGIVKMIELLMQQGTVQQLLAFAGMISLALAVFNILPIPALDGWRALSVLIQALGWRHPTTYFKIEGVLNMFFFFLLMALGIVIIFKDLHVARWVPLPFIG